MNSKRLYFVLLGSVGLLILALIGGAYLADQLIATQAKTLSAKRVQVSVLDAEKRQLAHAKADVQKYQTLADIAKSVVPQDKDQVQTVRQISSFADQNGIPLLSITFPSSTLGNPASKTSPDLSQLSTVTGVPGVYDLQIDVASDPTRPIPYSKFISFLSELERNRRTAEVTSISILPDNSNRGLVSFSLILNEYIKP